MQGRFGCRALWLRVSIGNGYCAVDAPHGTDDQLVWGDDLVGGGVLLQAGWFGELPFLEFNASAAEIESSIGERGGQLKEGQHQTGTAAGRMP